eukprot:GHRR01005398.1.p2 GENE.GHRR01005398.1~~GHRR01005398.1.p2  ORF type:complete len:151 (+),score=36.34 GHRR01005398.1:492-944(+)
MHLGLDSSQCVHVVCGVGHGRACFCIPHVRRHVLLVKNSGILPCSCRLCCCVHLQTGGSLLQAHTDPAASLPSRCDSSAVQLNTAWLCIRLAEPAGLDCLHLCCGILVLWTDCYYGQHGHIHDSAKPLVFTPAQDLGIFGGCNFLSGTAN